MVHSHPPVHFTNSELCSTIDALRSAMCNRTAWSLNPSHPIRVNDFEDVQIVIGDMVSSYAKSLMVLKEHNGAVPEFYDYFNLTPEIWDMLNTISMANEWSDLPEHSLSCKCVLCNQLADIH